MRQSAAGAEVVAGGGRLCCTTSGRTAPSNRPAAADLLCRERHVRVAACRSLLIHMQYLFPARSPNRCARTVVPEPLCPSRCVRTSAAPPGPAPQDRLPVTARVRCNQDQASRMQANTVSEISALRPSCRQPPHPRSAAHQAGSPAHRPIASHPAPPRSGAPPPPLPLQRSVHHAPAAAFLPAGP
jgi:hypothetical protein